MSTLLTPQQAAEYLGTTVGTLNTWRHTGKHNIPYVKWGGVIRYHKDALDAWIAEHTHNPTTQGDYYDA